MNLHVGPIDKTLLIRGDRLWQKDLQNFLLGKPQPIVSLPLSYRYAYGSKAQDTSDSSPFYTANPIGRDQTMLIDQFAPNIEYPASQVRSWIDQPAPAGFTAIPGHWQVRKALAGTYDQAQEDRRQPLLPEDFDPQFFQCAPIDQQVPGFLKGGEQVELTHLTPMKYWSFYLPKASFYLRTTFTDGYKKMHRAQLHTVIIEPDNHRIMMVWHSHLPCHHRVNQLEKTQIRLKKRILQAASNAPNPVWTGAVEDRS